MRERTIYRGSCVADFGLCGILRGERLQHGRALLEMRAPEVGIGNETRGCGILFPTGGIGCALPNGVEFGFQFASSGKKFEEPIAQTGIFKPVLAQQGFPCDRIAGPGRLISRQQVAHENRIVREALIGVLVQSQVKGWTASDYVVEILFELAALELCDRVAGQLLEFGISLLAQIVACQLVVPGFVWEALNRAAVHFFLLRSQPVLIEKYCQALVEARVVWVAVDLATQHAERGRDLFRLYQSSQIAIKNARIFRRTCASLLTGRLSLA